MNSIQRFRRLIIFLCYAIFSIHAQAIQNPKDSAKTALKAATSDSSKVITLHRLYVVTDSVTYAKQGLEIAQRISYNAGIAQALLDIGRSAFFEQKPDVALSNLLKSTAIAEKLGDKKVLIAAYRYIGYVYRHDDPFTSEEYYNKGLKLAQETGDELSASYLFSALGNVSEQIYEGNSENNQKALAFYLQSLEIRERIGSEEEIASSLNETSRIYDVLGFHDRGLALRLKGLEIAKKVGNTENIVYLCNVLGNEYSRQHDFKKALNYHLMAYDNVEKLTNNQEVFYDVTKGIAYDYYSLGEIKQSNIFYQKALAFNDSIKAENSRHEYNISGLKRNLEQELEKQKLLLKDLEISKAEAEVSRNNTLRNASFIVFAFILAIAIMAFRGNRVKQKSNRELELQNKKIEDANKVLAASENKFKLITETISDVFYLYNIIEKKYEYISANCLALFGLDQQFFYDGKSMKTIVLKDDLPRVVDANIAIDSGVAYDIEYRITINDEIKWVAEKSSPIYDEKGRLLMNSGICRDITSVKKTEEQIRQLNNDLQKNIVQLKAVNRELESFSYSIANNLKTPLRAILGCSKTLVEEYEEKLDEDGKALLNSMNVNGSKMGIMIEDLLRFSMLGREDIGKSDINMDALVESCIREVSDTIEHKAIINSTALLPAKGDYSLLSNVWTNLISNALKYSAKKENPQIDIGCKEEEDKIVYYVKDNGVGFDMTYVNQLFGLFQRLHKTEEFDGTGIGLAIVQRIVTRLGGRVWAVGIPGQGATFYFSLPKASTAEKN